MPYYPSYQTQFSQPYMMPQNDLFTRNNQPQQIQNGGFVVVSSEEDVRRYPVAPGTSIDFKIENQPIVIEKTMGFSQLDSPKIERFRLVKEEMEEAPVVKDYAEEIKEIREEVDKIKAEITSLKKPRQPKKEEKSENE